MKFTFQVEYMRLGIIRVFVNVSYGPDKTKRVGTMIFGEEEWIAFIGAFTQTANMEVVNLDKTRDQH